MEKLFILLVIPCIALGSPIAQEEGYNDVIGDRNSGLLLTVANDEQQSIAMLNMGDERVVELGIDEGENFRYEALDEAGGFQFGYDSHNVAPGEAEHFRHEVRRPDGTVVGRYGYRDANDVLRVTNYISDKDGYQVLKPGVIVQLEPVINNVNIEGNEIRGRSDFVEEEGPDVHVAVPQGARDLSMGPKSYGFYLPIQ